VTVSPCEAAQWHPPLEVDETRPPVRLLRSRPWWKSRKWLPELIEVTVAIAVLFLTSRRLVLALRVDGISMLPTLNDGQLLLVDRASHWLAVRTEVTWWRSAGHV